MKHAYKHTKPQPSWLLQGLMIRAGLYDPLPPVERLPISNPAFAAPYGKHKAWFIKVWDKVKAALVYDPDRT